MERAAKILNVRGYARIDAFVRIDENRNAETIIIEVGACWAPFTHLTRLVCGMETYIRHRTPRARTGRKNKLP